MEVSERSNEADSSGAPRRRKRKRRRNRFRRAIGRYLGYFGLRAAYAIVSRLPLPMGLALSRWVGQILYCFAFRLRRTGIENLTHVYGDSRSPKEIRRMVRDVFRNSAATGIEFMILRRWSTERLREAFPEVAAAVERLEHDVRESGSGIVGITAHFGNWEMLSVLVSRFAPGLLVPVAKPVYFEKYQAFVHRLRTEDGIEVIYNDESPRKLFRAIRKGQLLGLLPDQNLRTNSGVFVEFFGRPAYTATFPVDIARKLSVPMLFCVLARTDPTLRSRGYRILYEPPWTPPGGDDLEASRLAATAKWTAITERAIRESPVQWSWCYRRWKNQPGNPRLPHASRTEAPAT